MKAFALFWIGLFFVHSFLMISKGKQFRSFFMLQNGSEVDHKKFLKELEHRMVERKSTVRKVCQHPQTRKFLLQEYSKFLNVSQNWSVIDRKMPYRKEFLVRREAKLGWCKVPKAGSSSMVSALIRAFKIHDSRLKDRPGHGILIGHMPPLKEWEEYPDLKNFIIIRHPFSRILSAFRDKFHVRSRKIQFKKFRRLYGDEIIKRYRKEPILNTTYADMPTFREFCEYLIDTPARHYNEHWIPYYLSCAPCHIRYDSILKTETLEDDMTYLKNMTQLDIDLFHDHALPAETTDFVELQYLYPGNWNFSIGPDFQLPKDHKSLKDYIEHGFYATLTKDILKKLFSIYLLDFELFGYTIHPYDRYVQ